MKIRNSGSRQWGGVDFAICYKYTKVQCGLFKGDNVLEWLKCSKSKVTKVMNVMKVAEVIQRVKGFGSGKYVFVNEI